MCGPLVTVLVQLWWRRRLNVLRNSSHNDNYQLGAKAVIELIHRIKEKSPMLGVCECYRLRPGVSRCTHCMVSICTVVIIVLPECLKIS